MDLLRSEIIGGVLWDFAKYVTAPRSEFCDCHTIEDEEDFDSVISHGQD